MLQSRFSCVAALRGYIIWCLNHILNPFQATAMRIKQCWPTTISSTSSSSQWLSVYDRNFSRHKPLSFPKGRSNPKCQTKALGRGDSRGKQRLATFIKRRLANASITDAALFISYETAALETRTVVFPHSSPHLFSRPGRGGGRGGGGGWKGGGGGGGKGRGGENRMIRDHPTQAVHQGGRTETFCQNKLTWNNWSSVGQEAPVSSLQPGESACHLSIIETRPHI